MKKRALCIALLLCAVAPAATAGPYGEALGKCMVERSTDADKQQLVEWIFSALAYNPQISQYARMSSDQHAQIDSRMASLVEKLLTDYCRDEAGKAFHYEGGKAFSDAFKMLGEVAGQQIFESPAVTTGAMNFTHFIDLPKLVESLGAPKDSVAK